LKKKTKKKGVVFEPEPEPGKENETWSVAPFEKDKKEKSLAVERGPGKKEANAVPLVPNG
jgi:hypothetical protein